LLLAPIGLAGAGAIALAQTGGSENARSEAPAPSVPAPKTEAERIATFTAAGAPVHMLVNFGKPVTDGAVNALLAQAGAKPYRVFMTMGGMAGTHSAAPDKAGPEVIVEAREASVTQIRDVLGAQEKNLAKLVDSGQIERADEKRLGQLRDSLEREDRDRQMLAGFTGGRPIVYAVQVVGAESALAALRKSPQVTKLVVAYRVPDGRIVVPSPELPADYVAGNRPTSLKSKSREEVIALAKQRRAAR
jgi:hypothetical protein